MSGFGWLSFFALAALAVAGSIHVYRNRETAVRGRRALSILRASTLVLLILLLFDPELPTLGFEDGASTRVLLDASLSMSLGDSDGTRWAEGVARARRAADGEVVLFGDRVRAVSADELDDLQPTDARSELLPALRALAEAGVTRVLVITDAAVTDGAAVARWSARLGMDVDYQVVGESVADYAIVEAEAPGWAQSGQPLTLRYGVAGTGAPGTALVVTVSHEGATLAVDTVVSPGSGRITSSTVTFDAVGIEGFARYDVSVAAGDGAPDDDERSVYVYVSEEPAGVALVSFEPDWEPRFLHPILTRALGIPVGGYLRAGPDDWVRLGDGAEAGERVQEDVVQRAIERADLLVLHGVDARAPTWLQDAIDPGVPILAFPGSGPAWLPVPLELARPMADEWYATGEIPASPVAGSLAGIVLDQAPPLSSLHIPVTPPGSWTPLQARRGRRGEALPLVLAGGGDASRWAVVLATGFWRWAFRAGSPREAYDRLWSALAGWLIASRGSTGGVSVQPVRRVVSRGSPVIWSAPGVGSDSARVRIEGDDGTAVLDTVIALAGDTAVTPALPPGHYVYRVGAPDGSGEEAVGPLTVERYSPEFASGAEPLAAMQAAAIPVGRGGRAGPSRPLHATVWPYVVIILLVATELVLRRRWGLR